MAPGEITPTHGIVAGLLHATDERAVVGGDQALARQRIDSLEHCSGVHVLAPFHPGGGEGEPRAILGSGSLAATAHAAGEGEDGEQRDACQLRSSTPRSARVLSSMRAVRPSTS
jgi:hypothetical protein